MKQAYIAIALNKRQIMQPEIEAICRSLECASIVPFIFVDRYHFGSQDAIKMMQAAKRHMDESDILIAEISHKAIGIGVEVGYMAAQKKPIIYLRRNGADYSTTVGGMASYEIVYKDNADLQRQLISLIKSSGDI